jgi:ATP-dependent helicase/nuclease subunit B
MLFGPSPGPRVFALPPGADFIGALVAGLEARLAGQPPEALTDVEIWLNTRRAARALEARLAQGPARLLPRIRTVTDLASEPALAPLLDLPPPVSPLRRRLELARLVRTLLEETRLAPPAAAFELASSLDDLLGELGGEGIDPARLRDLDAGTHAAHWRTALRFLDIAATYAAARGPVAGEPRLRAAADAVARAWAAAPPAHPVPAHPIIVAGSTGSRAPTRAFMAAVSRLPQGAVVLPGRDPDLAPAVWDRVAAGDDGACDHPQHAFRALADALGFDPAYVPPWTGATPPAPARNALVALAMRPAPVTDQWWAEAPALVPTLPDATARLTWLEAPSAREEADAIALILREAAETGTSAALVTPDRTLARRVTARLARWSIVPDDSAGRPLSLTPPGVLLSLVAAIPAGRLSAETLLALLKHPLTASAPGARGPHLRLTRTLETGPLAGAPPLVDWPALAAWAATRDGAAPWLGWIRAALASPLPPEPAPLAALVAAHRAAAEALAAGPDADPAHGLWQKAAGEAASVLLAEIADADADAGPLAPADYRALLGGLFAARQVPEEAVLTHPGIAIWGTLEARIQTARRVVLAGLNEGTWPAPAAPDPWLSRPLRCSLGLASPETLIGLSAHDFAQAAAAEEVVLSRATRDAEAPTVPSRWLLRLENLLGGMGAPGRAALGAARARGSAWLDLARGLGAAAPAPPACRPAPIPPPEARPRRLSVSDVETLVRDPYAVYARRVLRLRRLDPPGREADALARGTALHAVLEAFVEATPDVLPEDAGRIFAECAARVLAGVPRPAVRAIWAARLARVAPWLLATEADRRTRARPLAREVPGRLVLGRPDVTLSARADRIDRTPDGAYAVYDYKSGALPSEKELRAFHLQLPLEAAIARAGGFENLPPAPAAHLELIGLSRGEARAIDPAVTDATLARLARLLGHYLDGEAGFAARLRPQRIAFAGDYDHLARLGEWSDGDPAPPEPLP